MRWSEIEETVRFNEVDEWGIAWYGHYMAWFEAGRMDLLRRFDLLPRQMVELGFIAPLVKLECEFKRPVSYGDVIVIRTTVVKPEIAALIFRFEVLLKGDRSLVARGRTTQVLLAGEDKKMVYRIDGELERRISAVVAHCGRDEA